MIYVGYKYNSWSTCLPAGILLLVVVLIYLSGILISYPVSLHLAEKHFPENHSAERSFSRTRWELYTEKQAHYMTNAR